MRAVLTLVFCLVCFVCVGGCGVLLESYYDAEIAKSERKIAAHDSFDRSPQLRSSKMTDQNIGGGYYLTYMPAAFTEATDVRQSRHQFLKMHLQYALKQHGLYPVEYSKAKYEIRYSYNTFPAFRGTFAHVFRLTITDREEWPTTTTEVWRGEVDIRKAASSDISLYFISFIVTAFEGFPESQDALQELIDRMAQDD